MIENPNELASNYAILAPHQFLQDFINESERAFDQVTPEERNLPSSSSTMGMQYMYVEFFGKEPKLVFQTLCKAAELGFNVSVGIDGFSSLVYDNDIVLLPATNVKTKTHRRLVAGFSRDRLERLKANGVNIKWVNVIENPLEKLTFLFSHRDHRKIHYLTYADQTIAWTGGMNMARVHFQMVDAVAKFTDPKIVKPLIDQFSDTGSQLQTKEVTCTDDTSLLIDSGLDKSIILQRAIAAVDGSQQSLLVSSAFHPTGKFLEALARARQRGVHIAYLTSNPAVEQGVLKAKSAVAEFMAKLKGQKIPLLYPKKKLVHFKALVSDESEVFIGSHNFIDMAHKETTLRSTNPQLVSNVVSFLKDVIGRENLTRTLDDNLVFTEDSTVANI